MSLVVVAPVAVAFVSSATYVAAFGHWWKEKRWFVMEADAAAEFSEYVRR